MIKLQCPQCGRRLTVSDRADGLPVVCLCGQRGLVRGPCFVLTKRGKPVVPKGKRKG